MTTHRILFCALALACAPAFAGTAEVRFIAPEGFSDLATDRSRDSDTMDALGQHLKLLAAQLPADQVLRVDVLDVNLAGTTRPTRRGNVRIVNGRADAPAIDLRYVLEVNGKPVRSGQDRLVDLGYTDQRPQWRTMGPYYYEKQLLTQWFARNFMPENQTLR